MKILIFLFSIVFSDKCKLRFMNSYNLEGFEQASAETLAICQSVKKNCCSKNDVKFLVQQYNQKFQPAVDGFLDRMEKLFQRLLEVHGSTSKISIIQTDDKVRHDFCSQKYNEFKEFNFSNLYKRLQKGFFVALRNIESVSKAFNCVLCDQSAHQYIDEDLLILNLSNKQCIRLIYENKEYIRAINLSLIDYVEKLQHFLDCSFYKDSYNFPFLFISQGNEREKDDSCLSKVEEDTVDMIESCKEICSSINITGISKKILGDEQFIDAILDYFENMVSEIEKMKKRKKKLFNPLEHLDEINRNNPIQIQLTDPRNLKLNRNLLLQKKKLKFLKFSKKLKKVGRKFRPRILEENPEVTKQTQVYDEFKYNFHQNSNEVYKRVKDPVDVSQFTIDYSDQGLNLYDYLSGLNLDINPNDLDKQQEQSLERQIVFLLNSCTQQNQQKWIEELKDSYTLTIPKEIESSQYKQLSGLSEAELDDIEVFIIKEEN